MDVLEDDPHLIGGMERQLACHHLKQHNPQRVDVSTPGNIVTAQPLFRRHVTWRAERGSSFRDDLSALAVYHPGDAQIGVKNVDSAIQHNIRGFDVTVTDALLM